MAMSGLRGMFMEDLDFDREGLCNRCRALMKSLGYGYVTVAEAMGVCVPTLSKFLKGITRPDFKRMSIIEKWIIETEKKQPPADLVS